MRERGQFGANPSEVIEVDLGHNDTGTVRKLAENFSPRIDDHRVPVGLKAFCALPELARRDDVNLIFDRSRAQQRFPMRFACIGRKG